MVMDYKEVIDEIKNAKTKADGLNYLLNLLSQLDIEEKKKCYMYLIRSFILIIRNRSSFPNIHMLADALENLPIYLELMNEDNESTLENNFWFDIIHESFGYDVFRWTITNFFIGIRNMQFQNQLEQERKNNG